MHVTLFFVHVVILPWIWSSIVAPPFSMESLAPVLYPRSACSTDNAVAFFMLQTLGKCQSLCARLQQCGLINYDPMIKLCVLQQRGTNQTSSPGHCISLLADIDDVTGLTQSCAINPCDNNSLCVPIDNSADSYCEPFFCERPPHIQHATTLLQTSPRIGTNTTYLCNSGYTGIGHAEIKCLENRTWSTADIVCYPNCPTIPVKTSAELVSWFPLRLFVNTTVHYVCKPGFYNLTAPLIVCDADGLWSEFDCLPFCYYSQLPALANGAPRPGNVTYTRGMTAEYTCYNGFYLTQGPPLSTCDDTGSWSALLVQCLPYCYHSNLPRLENGAPVAGHEYTVNMAEEFTCHHGYYLSPGSPFVSCDKSGAWSALQVTCFKHCSAPNDPADGYISTLPDAPYVDGSVAVMKCNSGHYIFPLGDDVSTVTCQTDGTWVYAAECYRHCDQLPGTPLGCSMRLVSTGAPYTVDTYVQYKAWTTNYISTDTDRKRCTRHGGWDGTVVCCVHTWKYDWAKGRCVFFRK